MIPTSVLLMLIAILVGILAWILVWSATLDWESLHIIEGSLP